MAGAVDHAIRITAQRTDRTYVRPARHQAGAARDPSLPPMGARFRLKAGFPLAGFRSDTQAVLRAMQRYGVIVADNGSNWYFTGTSEQGWDTAMLDEMVAPPQPAGRRPAGGGGYRRLAWLVGLNLGRAAVVVATIGVTRRRRLTAPPPT